MAHTYAHPEHLLHLEQIHWDEWVTMVLTAAILAVLVVGGLGFSEGVSLMSDPSLAP